MTKIETSPAGTEFNPNEAMVEIKLIVIISANVKVTLFSCAINITAIAS